MPEDPADGVIPRDYSRLLPRQEAAGAVVVASIAWLFVAGFMAALITLDMTNIIDSLKTFNRNIKYILEKFISEAGK